MALQYPAEWKFEGIGFAMPEAAVTEFLELLLSIGEGSQAVLEEFKIAFGGSAWSSSYDWAVSDLSRLVDSRKPNAALFVDSLWKSIEQANTQQLSVPSAKVINNILAKHGLPLSVEPPHLRLTKDLAVVVTSDVSTTDSPSGPVATFVLRGEIGRGGYGVVYRATRTTAIDEFEYALKILDPSPFIVDYDKAIKRFRREVAALRALQHRSIVHYFEAGLTVENKPYVVMPLIVGRDLRTAASASDLHHALRMFVEVLTALDYAHQSDVVHRDLKPSNIIVRSSDTQPIVLDFGSAFVLDQLDSKTLTTHAVGTIGYIPSEVIADPTLRSPLQDIYACGIMLYEVLGGRRPDPANYVPLGSFRPECAALDRVVLDAISGANVRMTSAREFADRLSNHPL